MIKLSYSTLRSDSFHMVFSKLCRSQEFSVQTAYQIAKLKDKIRKELQIEQDLFLGLVRQYCKLDEKGEILPIKQEDKVIPGTFEIVPEKQDEWNAKYGEFIKQEITIDRDPIGLKDIGSAELSADDLLAIEPILEA